MLAMEMVKGLGRKVYEEWLRSLALFSLGETEERPHGSLQLPRERRGGADTDLLSVVSSDRTPVNGMKLKEQAGTGSP